MNEHNSVILNNRNGNENSIKNSKRLTSKCSIRYFEFQLKHLSLLNKPLFLHNRAASNDLYDILVKYRDQIKAGGVVSPIMFEKENVFSQFVRSIRFIRLMEH